VVLKGVTMIRISIALVLSLAASACVDDASATTQASTVASGPPRCPPPPKEVFDACASSTAGAACSFDIHVAGTCRNGPDANAPLACAPEAAP
jgi:hypothetical protein